jgi:pyruvate decarboxylase
MYEHVTVAQANLLDPSVCLALIDLTLLRCFKQSRPVYIELAIDMVSVMVDSLLLESPITGPELLSEPFPQEHAAVYAALSLSTPANDPQYL